MTVQAHIDATPSRARPFEKTQQPTPALLRKLLGRDLAPSRGEFSAVLEALNVGDPAMDSLVDWMMDYGPRESRALFETATTEGLAAIPDCPEPLRLFIKSVERRPAWVDFDLIDEGARFIHSTGMTAPYVLRDLALMGGLPAVRFQSVAGVDRGIESGRFATHCRDREVVGRLHRARRPETFQCRFPGHLACAPGAFAGAPQPGEP